MPEFLDGIEQGGGGLTTVGDVTVSGGAVTTLDTGTITIENGKWYNLYAEVVLAGSSTRATLLFNGTSISSSYASTNVYCGASSTPAALSYSSSQSATIGYGTAGHRIFLSGRVKCDGARVIFKGHDFCPERTGASNKQYIISVAYTASSLDSVQITSDAASGCDDTSKITITEAY